MRRIQLVAAGALALACAPAFAVDHAVTALSGPNRFEPASLTINVGDTVTFTNGGGFHNVVSDAGSVTAFRCANGCDGDGGTGNGDGAPAPWTATVTFPTAGTAPYHCEVHGVSMSGLITINASGGSAVVNVDPPALSGTAGAGANTTTSFDIANSGTAALDWTLDQANADCATPATVPWIALSATSGTVDAGGSPAIVGVTLDATALAEGIYDANLCLHSNDTAHALVTIPVEFTVTPSDVIFEDGFEG